jgi:hypothetical protein
MYRLSKPGGKIRDMHGLVEQHVQSHRQSRSPKNHMYVISGICDIARKLKCPGNNYQEIVCDADADALISHMKFDYNGLIEHIRSHNIAPILATIYPIDISKANRFYLDEAKTQRLIFTPEYPGMQAKLLYICKEINDFIIHKNEQLDLNTPRLHDPVMAGHTFCSTRLFDGIHPNDILSEELDNILCSTMLNNRY